MIKVEKMHTHGLFSFMCSLFDPILYYCVIQQLIALIYFLAMTWFCSVTTRSVYFLARWLDFPFVLTVPAGCCFSLCPLFIFFPSLFLCFLVSDSVFSSLRFFYFLFYILCHLSLIDPNSITFFILLTVTLKS